MCTHATEIRQVDQGWDEGGHWVKKQLWCDKCGWIGQPWKQYDIKA